MSQEPGPPGPGRAGHGTQLAGSARQPVGVLACRRPPAHLPGVPRRRPGPPAAARRGRAGPARGPGHPDGPDGGPTGHQHRGRCARRHLYRRLPGAAGRAAGHRVVRPAGRARPTARADVGVQVRRRLRGRRAHRPRPARPRRRDHELRSGTGWQRLRRRLVRHVYDMRSGVRFLEEYANPDSDIRRLDDWVGRQESAEPGQGEPRGLYRFLATLRAEAPHGERFLYRSAESDVLGWVCERAAGGPWPRSSPS